MLFTEPSFLFLFLPLVLGSYFLLRAELRNPLLLLVSLLFYFVGESAWLWLLLASVGVNYALGLGLGPAAPPRWRRVVLGVGVLVNLAPLVLFKTLEAMSPSATPNAFADPIGIAGAGPLQVPLGLSFYTFHAISYLVDLYRRTADPERQPVNFGLYMTMFPQLICGPIVRYHQIARQLPLHPVRLDDFAEGSRRFIIGLGKKMLLANPLGECADAVFALPPDQLDAGTAWLGLLCYSLQIYYDFSGYSDMAIGLARMFGFTFPENFNFPYAATSVSDFWRRWHMTLSAWLRDYVYIPLGGNRCGPGRMSVNLMLVFVLSALWHKVSVLFLVRAGYFALLIVLERLLASRLGWMPPRPIRHGYLILVVLLGWVVFRTDSAGHALGYYSAMFFRHGETPAYTLSFLLTPHLITVLLAAVLGCFPWYRPLLQWWGDLLDRQPEGGLRTAGLCATYWSVEMCFFTILLTLSILSCASTTASPFLYYRF